MRKTRASKVHKTDDGRYLPCNANPLNPRSTGCPYKNNPHYESMEDALSTRQRQARKLGDGDVVHFSEIIGTRPYEDDEAVSPRKALRSVGEAAKLKFEENGFRPASPLGDISVYLPTGQEVHLSRETFDATTGKIGTRWYMRYRLTPNDNYRSFLAPMNSPGDMRVFDEVLQGYFADAGNRSVGTLGLSRAKEVSPVYEKTMRAVQEVEVMSRGSERAYTELGVRLFERHGDRLLLTTTYSGSCIQAYDIEESLRVASYEDKDIRMVEVQVSEELPKTKRGRWMLDRTPDGTWYAGGISQGKWTMRAVADSADAMEAVAEVIVGNDSDDEGAEEQLRMVRDVYEATERGVVEYERRVNLKKAGADLNDPRPVESDATRRMIAQLRSSGVEGLLD